MADKENQQDNAGDLTEFLLYTGPDGHIYVEVMLQDETIWLSQ